MRKVIVDQDDTPFAIDIDRTKNHRRTHKHGRGDQD